MPPISVNAKCGTYLIADAVLCVYDGGPRWRRNAIAPLGTILIGTDPVAVDAVLLGTCLKPSERSTTCRRSFSELGS